MPTIEELLDELFKTNRGKIFLVNLIDTLDRHFLSAIEVIKACEEFILVNTAGGNPLPENDELVDRLGYTCVAEGLWRKGPEPILERHLLKSEFVLSRVTSYSKFYSSVLGRSILAPSIPDLPTPIDLSSGKDDEIDPSNVSKVHRFINSA